MRHDSQKKASDKLREYNARRNKKYKRRRRAAVYLVLLFFVCDVCMILSLTVFFNTSEIKIVGNSRYTTEQVMEASGVKKGDNLLRINRKGIKKDIFKNLPYTSDVRIIRELPSTVTIKITESEPACYCETGDGRYALLSGELRVMEIVSSVPEKTAFLSGLDMTVPEVGEKACVAAEVSEKILFDLLTILEENDIININNITFGNAINVTLKVEDRVTVKLGGDAELEYKIAMVGTYLKDCLPSVGEWTIDVTSGDKLYASRTPAAPPEKVESSDEGESENKSDSDSESGSSEGKDDGDADGDDGE